MTTIPEEEGVEEEETTTTTRTAHEEGAEVETASDLPLYPRMERKQAVLEVAVPVRPQLVKLLA